MISRRIVKKILYSILFKQQMIDLVWFPLESCALTWLIWKLGNGSLFLWLEIWLLVPGDWVKSEVEGDSQVLPVVIGEIMVSLVTHNPLIKGNEPSWPLRWFSVFLSCESVWPWNCSWFWWSRMGGTVITLITTSIWVRVPGLWKYSNCLTLFGCPSNAMLQISQVILCIHPFYRSRQCMRDMVNFIAEYWGAEIRTEVPDF